MLLEEKAVDNVLIGGIDEITDFSFGIINRFGLFKKDISSSLNLFSEPSRGSIAGEGAAFFLLNSQPSAGDYATLDGITTFYKPFDDNETTENIQAFLEEQSISINDIDIVSLWKKWGH